MTIDLAATRQQIAPLYAKYDGQLQPQPAYISLDLETGRIDADYSGEIGNAVPASVWHGRVRRYTVPSDVKGSALADLLESDEFRALATRILAGGSSEWDGNNYVGRLTDDAQAAEDALERLIDRELQDSDARGAVWGKDELGACDLLEHWPEGKTLDEAVTDLERCAKDEGAQLETDARDYLLDEAFSEFRSSRRRQRLGEIHIAALRAAELIDADDEAEWREERDEA